MTGVNHVNRLGGVALLALPLLYLLLPGHPLGWFNGLPLRPLALAALVLYALVLFAVGAPHQALGHDRRARRPARALLALFGLLVAAKLAVAAAAPAYGLLASYYARPEARGQPERSTEFPGLSATRVDRRLRFSGDQLPLYFFNDNLRFNYYQEDEPDRTTLPFAVRWSGWLDVPAAREYTFWLRAAGRARLAIEGLPPLEVDSGGQIQSVQQRAKLPAGVRRIEVEYLRLTGQPAELAVEWDPEAAPEALAAPYLLPWPAALPSGLAHPLIAAAQGLDVLFLGGLVALAALLLRAGLARSVGSPRPAPSRPLLALLLGAVFLYAALSSLPLRERVVLLDGGSDFLTYETYARDIQLNGPLMTLGRPLGKGRPYFFQPFYPYALAAGHWLTGEDLYGVVVLQVFGLGVAAALVAALGARLFGPAAGVASLALVLGLLGPLQLEWVARHLLSENIYFWLLPASALALLELAARPSWRRGLLAGTLLGLCCVTRAPTLLWLPFALAITARLMRPAWSGPAPATGPAQRSPARGRRAALAAAALAAVAVIALVPLRNAIVSGHPALVATNGPATMQLAHPLTPKVDLRGVEKNPLYRALRIERATIEMIEFIRQDPLGYGATLLPLGLYALGVPGMLESGAAPRWELLLLVGLYLASLGGSAARQPAAWLLHSFIGLHFLVMMIFLPNSYGYRQVLPMYLFIAVFAGQMVAALGRILLRVRGAAERPEQQPKAVAPEVDHHVQRAGAAPGDEQLA